MTKEYIVSIRVEAIAHVLVTADDDEQATTRAMQCADAILSDGQDLNLWPSDTVTVVLRDKDPSRVEEVYEVKSLADQP